MLALLHNNIKITFEDKGQDYLTWVIDPKGNVLDAQPYCAVSLSEIVVQDRVFYKGQSILYKKGEHKQFVPFKVEKVEDVI